MYTFPDTGGEVISSFALVAIFSIVTAEAPYQLTQVQRLRVFSGYADTSV